MALTITTQLTTRDGFVIDNAYGRVAVANNFGGDEIQAALAIYPSELAFNNGATPVTVALQLGATQTYDYDTGEKNILDLAHDIMIAKLADQGVTATKNL